MLYQKFIYPVWCRKDPESARKWVTRFYRFFSWLPLGSQLLRLLYTRNYPQLSGNFFGIQMPNPIGLAAGFDPKGSLTDILLDSGFAYVQTGPFYDKEGTLQGIVNLRQRKRSGVIAARISGKSAGHDMDEVVRNYETAMSLLYEFVDMFVFYVEESDMDLDGVLDKRICADRYKPVLLHVAPEMTEEELDEVLHYSLLSGVDGLIVGGTTYEKTLSRVRYLSQKGQGRMPVIASGGICTPQQAAEVLSQGAIMIELHDGLIQEGPGITRKILKTLNK